MSNCFLVELQLAAIGVIKEVAKLQGNVHFRLIEDVITCMHGSNKPDTFILGKDLTVVNPLHYYLNAKPKISWKWNKGTIQCFCGFNVPTYVL